MVSRMITTKTSIWYYLNDIKVEAVKMGFTAEQLYSVKKECDDLFCQATGSNICPAYWIGGW